jgi:hypothetical protein
MNVIHDYFMLNRRLLGYGVLDMHLTQYPHAQCFVVMQCLISTLTHSASAGGKKQPYSTVESDGRVSVRCGYFGGSSSNTVLSRSG